MLHLESTMLERIRQAVPAGVKVFSAADLAGAQANFQFAPAVHVIFSGYRVKRNAANNLVCEVEQTWLTVVAVRNARDQKAGAAARGDSGDLTKTVFDAMAGWLPEGSCRPFSLADGPGSGFDEGVFFIPLAWRTVVELARDVEDDFPVLKKVTADYAGDDKQEIPE